MYRRGVGHGKDNRRPTPWLRNAVHAAECGVTKSTTMCGATQKYFVTSQRILNRGRKQMRILHNAELTWLMVTGNGVARGGGPLRVSPFWDDNIL